MQSSNKKKTLTVISKNNKFKFSRSVSIKKKETLGMDIVHGRMATEQWGN